MNFSLFYPSNWKHVQGFLFTVFRRCIPGVWSKKKLVEVLNNTGYLTESEKIEKEPDSVELQEKVENESEIWRAWRVLRVPKKCWTYMQHLVSLIAILVIAMMLLDALQNQALNTFQRIVYGGMITGYLLSTY